MGLLKGKALNRNAEAWRYLNDQLDRHYFVSKDGAYVILPDDDYRKHAFKLALKEFKANGSVNSSFIPILDALPENYHALCAKHGLRPVVSNDRQLKPLSQDWLGLLERQQHELENDVEFNKSIQLYPELHAKVFRFITSREMMQKISENKRLNPKKHITLSDVQPSTFQRHVIAGFKEEAKAGFPIRDPIELAVVPVVAPLIMGATLFAIGHDYFNTYDYFDESNRANGFWGSFFGRDLTRTKNNLISRVKSALYAISNPRGYLEKRRQVKQLQSLTMKIVKRSVSTPEEKAFILASLEQLARHYEKTLPTTR